MDEKKNYLFSEGLAAINRQDWDAVYKYSSYDAEMGALFLKIGEDRIPLETKCRIALEHYSNHGDNYPVIRKYIRKAGVIRKDNWRSELPPTIRKTEVFTIYRGGGEDIKKAAYSLSWTLSQEVAEWFMKRHEVTNPGSQHLYRGNIPADKVITYIGDRKEFEIVQYRGVKNIEEIAPVGVSDEFYKMRAGNSNFSIEDPSVYQNYFDKWYSAQGAKS